jgi:hypothetical protein
MALFSKMLKFPKKLGAESKKFLEYHSRKFEAFNVGSWKTK